MKTKRRNLLQFSLASLMIFVAAAAVFFMICGVLGPRMCCGIVVIAALFWTTNYLISHPPEPSDEEIPCAQRRVQVPNDWAMRLDVPAAGGAQVVSDEVHAAESIPLTG